MVIDLFVSHSTKDIDIVEPLVEFLQSALLLSATSIRCTSLDGYRLPGGARTDEQLRLETREARTFVGLLSSHSLASLYVAFELGARWGAGKHLVPLLAPELDTSSLTGPLAAVNALRVDNAAQLQQLARELANVLGIEPQNPDVYQRKLERLVRASRRRTRQKDTIVKSHDLPAELPAESPLASSYSEAISRAFKLLDSFVHYSQVPPTGTYEDWSAAEGRVKDWLMEHQVDADRKVLDFLESYVTKIRASVERWNRMAQLWGGDGRPPKSELNEFENEMRREIKTITEYIRGPAT